MKRIFVLVFVLAWAVPGFCWRDALEYNRSMGEWTYQGGAPTPLEETKGTNLLGYPQLKETGVVAAPKVEHQATKVDQEAIVQRPVSGHAAAAAVKATPKVSTVDKKKTLAKATSFDFRGNFSETGASFDQPSDTFKSSGGIFNESFGSFKSSDGIFGNSGEVFDEPSADFSAQDGK